MDVASKQAMRLLEAMAQTRQRLWDLTCNLQLHPLVDSARDGVSFRRYSDRALQEERTPWLEFRVRAELHNDKEVSGWLGIHWEEDVWMVRAFVRLDHGEDREAYVLQIEDQRAATVDEFINILQVVGTKVIEAIQSVRLEAV